MNILKDLHVSPPAYNTALALYFVAYVIFEVPANVSTVLTQVPETRRVLRHCTIRLDCVSAHEPS